MDISIYICVIEAKSFRSAQRRLPKWLALIMKRGSTWRTGKYYSNSGLGNILHPRLQVTPAESLSAAKPFHHNSELREAALSVLDNYPFRSLRTECSVPYDPVFHTTKSPSLPTTHLRLKGFGERVDRRLLSTDTREYVEALRTDPLVFHRRSGEFTSFNDACRRVQAGPFARGS